MDRSNRALFALACLIFGIWIVPVQAQSRAKVAPPSAGQPIGSVVIGTSQQAGNQSTGLGLNTTISASKSPISTAAAAPAATQTASNQTISISSSGSPPRGSAVENEHGHAHKEDSVSGKTSTESTASGAIAKTGSGSTSPVVAPAKTGSSARIKMGAIFVLIVGGVTFFSRRRR